MSDIPKARTLLWRARIAMTVTAARRLINKALPLLARRKGNYRAHGTRAKMTPALRLRIKAWATSHAHWTQQRIAERYNVTNARVSEILSGKNK